MQASLLLVHALSPIHCGTGQAAGGVDLPIAREKSTEIPLIPGSSLKGVLRARSEGPMTYKVFGPDTEAASEHAGSVQFGDASLALLPVRSVLGTVAWATSPYLLLRLLRDARLAGCDLGPPPSSPRSVDEVILTSGKLKDPDGVVIFEDLDFHGREDDAARSFAERLGNHLFEDQAERDHFTDRVCVVHDDIMKLLLKTGMEVIARNRIDQDSGTVANGGLWTEEALPVESILSGVIVATPVRATGATVDELLAHVERILATPVQIGGGASIGRGLCGIRVAR